MNRLRLALHVADRKTFRQRNVHVLTCSLAGRHRTSQSMQRIDKDLGIAGRLA